MKVRKKRFVGVICLLMICLFAGLTAMAQSPDPAPDFFIEAEIDNPSPYVGQQVTYSVLRYHAVHFPNPPYYNDHPFDGFWHLPLLQRPAYTATLGGRLYQVHQTYLALFPTKPGALTIAPSQLVIPNDGPEADLIIESAAIGVEVKPLPPGAPSDFSGAVGQFQIETKLKPLEGQVNEVMTFTLTLEGQGNLETISAPDLPSLQYWRFFDPQIKTDLPLSKEKVSGARHFQWSVVPGRPGDHQIPPVHFSYYDPEDDRYYTVSSSPLTVNVLPADDDGSLPPPLVIEGNQQQVVKLTSDIRHIKPAPAIFQTTLSYTIRRFIYGLGLVSPLLALTAAWLWQRWQHFQTTPQARRRQAGYQARQLLQQAQDTSGAVYSLIHRAIATYLSEQLGQAVSGLTLEQLAEQLQQARLDPRLAERTFQLLTQVEAQRFAPTEDQAASQELIAESQRLIDDLEAFFKRRQK